MFSVVYESTEIRPNRGEYCREACGLASDNGVGVAVEADHSA